MMIDTARNGLAGLCILLASAFGGSAQEQSTVQSIEAAFIIVHLYLLTIGPGFRAHVKPMITGYKDINLTPEQEAYLEESEPWRLKAKEGRAGFRLALMPIKNGSQNRQ